jgi:hypothetical protein
MTFPGERSTFHSPKYRQSHKASATFYYLFEPRFKETT